jgi:hypothetical protein
VLEYKFQELRQAKTNKGTDKDQVFFLEELRNTTLELVKKFHEGQESKFQCSGMGVFTTYKLEDKVQEFIFWSLRLR